MAIRTTDVVVITGPAVGQRDPIPSGRRKDTKHIYLPGFGGAHNVRADVNEKFPLPVYSVPAEISMREGGMFAKHALVPGDVRKLATGYDNSRPG